jgi:hypothetical protein
MKRLHYGPLQHLRKEGIFIWGVISADEGMQSLGFGEDIVSKGDVGWQSEIAAWYGQSAGIVNGRIEWKLNTFNQVEGDCIFEPTCMVSVPYHSPPEALTYIS